ncbi:uncharacterized protein LOC119650270 [Hermetia illucens]|uniref:uncharacterized protein LOC119650270 n=1 Tax=Hermetia illucens TaxID=343691 RepID=UPI0018CC2357|nr:uncharacterized protein LOC119650270 [Hermetia illucens]
MLSTKYYKHNSITSHESLPRLMTGRIFPSWPHKSTRFNSPPFLAVGRSYVVLQQNIVLRQTYFMEKRLKIAFCMLPYMLAMMLCGLTTVNYSYNNEFIRKGKMTKVAEDMLRT